MLHNNITNNYRKTDQSTVEEINIEAAIITEKLGVDDRVDSLKESPPSISIKDHKTDFPKRTSCRLINPTRSNMGKISKRILDKINKKIRLSIKVNQWRSTGEVLVWFQKLTNKEKKAFIKFDIDAYYPSITNELFQEALKWAKGYIEITKEEEETIMNSRKNLISKEGDTWVKKENPEFDITMGNDDGAEACELVGLYLLENLSKIVPKEDIGLYRDDGLLVIENNGPTAAKIEKKLHNLFKKYKLSIQVEANITTTDFLDIILDLKTGTTKPFRKENDTPLYINVESNHPPCIKKQLPNMISKRLSGLSTSEKEFKEAIPIYEKALKDAGYKEKIQYEEKQESNKKKNRKRSRNITWFTPPYNQEVKTNITKEFLKILNKSFPEDNPLKKIFNKNTVKISYSTTKNVSRIIAAHNRQVIRGNAEKTTTCNCRGGTEQCPVQGKCNEEGVIYQADVTADQESDKTYIGAAATSFKLRHSNHTKSFRHRIYEFDTELSKYIWDLKDKERNYKIAWKIIRKAQPYTPTSGKCDLCITEKTIIANYKDKKQLLNSRNELMAKCRHREKWLLTNWKGRGNRNNNKKNKVLVAEKTKQININPPIVIADENLPNQVPQTIQENKQKRLRKSTKRLEYIYK